jgi:hypothetical protein
MTTFDYSADSDRAAAALTGPETRSGNRSDLAREKLHGDAGGSYGRALAGLIIAIADITSEPNPIRPPVR